MAGVAGFEPTVMESESIALPLGDTPILFPSTLYIIYSVM